MFFFEKPIFSLLKIVFNKNLQCCSERRTENLSLVTQNLSALYLKLQCFGGILTKKMMFLQENHHFPNTSIFRPLFSINLVLICSRALCSTAAIWYTKGLKRSLPGIKNPCQWFMAATSQPFFFSLGREAWDVKSSCENFPQQKIMTGKKVSEKNTIYKNNLSKDESWFAPWMCDWTPDHSQVILLLLLVHVWNTS